MVRFFYFYIVIFISFDCFAGQQPCQNSGGQVLEPKKSSDLSTSVSDIVSNCALTPDCSRQMSSRRDRLWGQNYIDTDLMLESLSEIKPSVTPKIAVIDHGFDTKQLGHLSTPSRDVNFEDPFRNTTIKNTNT